LIPDPSNPQAWNQYSYVGNNPIGYSDPTFGGELSARLFDPQAAQATQALVRCAALTK
jgi:hypothetical protein